MFNLISGLGSKNWRSSAEEIYIIVKDELTGNKGYIKKVRNETDADRRKNLATIRKNLKLDIANLDETMNQFTDEMYQINSSYDFSLQHDFTSILNQYMSYQNNDYNGICRVAIDQSDMIYIPRIYV